MSCVKQPGMLLWVNLASTFNASYVGARPVALYADEGLLDAPKENAFKSMFWEGGTQGDAFLAAAAAQVATGPSRTDCTHCC